MEAQTISSSNLRCLFILMVLCGSLINGAFTLEQDTWIAVLLMGVLFFPAMLIYSRIAALCPQKTLYDTIESLFGPIFGFVVVLCMSLYALMITALELRNFTEFTAVIALQETPRIPLMIALILPVIYLAFQGVQVLGRWSRIVCTIILVNVALTILLSLNILDASHILPIMDHSLNDIASNSFTVGSISVGETVMGLIIIGYLKEGESPYRAYLPGVLIGVAVFAVIILRNLFILGPHMEQAAKFSTYMAVRIIDLGNFFERIESSISFIYILLGITKMTVSLLAASMGAAKLLKSSDHTRLLVPISLLTLAICTGVFQNVFEMFSLAWQYRYYALPFQLLIPLLVWIFAEYKARQRRKQAA